MPIRRTDTLDDHAYMEAIHRSSPPRLENATRSRTLRLPVRERTHRRRPAPSTKTTISRRFKIRETLLRRWYHEHENEADFRRRKGDLAHAYFIAIIEELARQHPFPRQRPKGDITLLQKKGVPRITLTPPAGDEIPIMNVETWLDLGRPRTKNGMMYISVTASKEVTKEEYRKQVAKPGKVALNSIVDRCMCKACETILFGKGMGGRSVDEIKGWIGKSAQTVIDWFAH